MSAGALFDAAARDYDRARRQLVPDFDSFLEGPEKQRVFRRVYESLSPGGVFVNADQVLGVTREIEERYHKYWLRRAREAGIAERDLDAALERMKEDKQATLASQLAWLAKAGFDPVDCTYKDHQFAVYGGYKRGGKELAAGQTTEEVA